MVIVHSPPHSSGRHHPRSYDCSISQQRGAVVVFTVSVLMVIALLLLIGPYELARATWLLSQSVEAPLPVSAGGQ